MHDELIKRLLHSGEAGMNSPLAIESAQLSEQVRALDRRRRRAHRAAMAAIAVGALTVAGFWQLSEGDQSVPFDTPTAKQLSVRRKPATQLASTDIERELARVESDLRVSEQMVAMVQRDREVSESRGIRARLDLQDEIRIETDVVADGMLRRADESIGDMVIDEAGIAAYERLIELFPHSHPAQVARQRMDDLRN